MLKNASWIAARDLLLEQARPAETEAVPLDQCGGRVLAFDLRAEEDVPPFDRSAYDGYAFIASDTQKATPETPVTLSVIGTVYAEDRALKITHGQAVHLMTGTRIPEGADCVINFERTTFTEDTVTLFHPVRQGDNVVRRGEDVVAGTELAIAGTVIDAGVLGVLAGQGYTEAEVFRKPAVGLISTGSELAEPGEERKDGQIYNSSRFAVTAFLQKEGCDVHYLGSTKDDLQEITSMLREGLDSCDAVIVTGGVSVGDHDLTPQAMELAGAEILVRGVRMKPGMACAYGIRDKKLILGLSGNPASAMTQLCVCALPAIRKMCGKKDVLPRTFSAVLAQEFHKKSGTDRFLRGYLDIRDGRVRFIRSDGQGNAMLSGMIGCEAFVLVPAGSGPQNAGSVLEGIQL